MDVLFGALRSAAKLNCPSTVMALIGVMAAYNVACIGNVTRWAEGEENERVD